MPKSKRPSAANWRTACGRSCRATCRCCFRKRITPAWTRSSPAGHRAGDGGQLPPPAVARRGFIDEYIYDDPLGLSFGALGKLQELNIGGNYTLCDDYLFSKDMTTLLVFISPHYQSGDTGVGDRLIERIESALEG